MALINCPECGKEISSNAKSCPHCGCEITICPDCNSVFTNRPGSCPNCGHVFNYSTNNENQSIQNDFRDYIKSKSLILKIAWIIGGSCLPILATGAWVVIGIIFFTLPKDPLELIYALNSAQRTIHIAFISYGIIEFIAMSIVSIFNEKCNFLHILAANKMSLTEIDGVKYCKEHQNSLNNVSKKANEWTFALNAAYRQADKSSIKYTVLIILSNLIFGAIQIICGTIWVYQLLDKGIYCIIWEVEFDFFKSINYIAIVIAFAAAVARTVIQKKLINRYTENLKQWCITKALPINEK